MTSLIPFSIAFPLIGVAIDGLQSAIPPTTRLIRISSLIIAVSLRVGIKPTRLAD